jgi:hypothetical protein
MSDTPFPLSRHPAIDELDRAIVDLAARINAATYELLVLVRQFDERAGWLRWGLANCTEWLHWRCDLSMNAAREKVRVAHALKMLPAISQAFSKGELSYSKVRALTREARSDNEAELLAFALKTTAARVDEHCRELRNGSNASTEEAHRSHLRRSLTVRRDPSRGTMIFTIELPVEKGELIDKALDRARETSAFDHPEFAEESWRAIQADALVTMANDYLNGRNDGASGTADNYQVTVHVDRSALANGKGRSGLPIESVKRLCCDSDTVVIVDDENGEPLNIGRKTRTVPTAVKRALWARDKGCVFPGCRHKRFVDAHHIEHWSAGGKTSLDNLMLLCSKHHRLVHEGGFRIERDYRDRWCFKRPDGIAVPACGYHPEDMTDDVSNEIAGLVNNPPAGGLSSASPRKVCESGPYHKLSVAAFPNSGPSIE